MKTATNRLALIAALCSKGALASVLVAGPSEVREEVTLTGAHRDNESILDEGENITEISTLLADRIETVNEQFGAESLELTEAERKEVGVLFKAKPSQVVIDDEDAEFNAFKKSQGWE